MLLHLIFKQFFSKQYFILIYMIAIINNYFNSLKFPSDSTSKSDVFWANYNPSCMNCDRVCVLKQSNQVSLSSFLEMKSFYSTFNNKKNGFLCLQSYLKRTKRTSLEAKTNFELLGNFPNHTLER